jgi:hypothetical protein
MCTRAAVVEGMPAAGAFSCDQSVGVDEPEHGLSGTQFEQHTFTAPLRPTLVAAVSEAVMWGLSSRSADQCTCRFPPLPPLQPGATRHGAVDVPEHAMLPGVILRAEDAVVRAGVRPDSPGAAALGAAAASLQNGSGLLQAVMVMAPSVVVPVSDSPGSPRTPSADGSPRQALDGSMSALGRASSRMLPRQLSSRSSGGLPITQPRVNEPGVPLRIAGRFEALAAGRSTRSLSQHGVNPSLRRSVTAEGQQEV